MSELRDHYLSFGKGASSRDILEADKKEFYCPCHDGRYDEFGDVLAGPPPIPLEQIPVQVEGGVVTVGEI